VTVLGDRSNRSHKFYQMEMTLDRIRLIQVKKVPSLTIRNYHASDAKGLVRVFNSVFLGSNDPIPRISEQDLDDLPSDRILLAESEGEIVGFLMCGIKTLEGEVVGVIGYVGVISKWRRKGVATLLAVEAGRYFLKNRLKKVICEVYYLNKNSYKFIESFGFSQTATIYVPVEDVVKSLYRVKL